MIFTGPPTLTVDFETPFLGSALCSGLKNHSVVYAPYYYNSTYQINYCTIGLPANNNILNRDFITKSRSSVCAKIFKLLIVVIYILLNILLFARNPNTKFLVR